MKFLLAIVLVGATVAAVMAEDSTQQPPVVFDALSAKFFGPKCGGLKCAKNERCEKVESEDKKTKKKTTEFKCVDPNATTTMASSAPTSSAGSTSTTPAGSTSTGSTVSSSTGSTGSTSTAASS